MFKPILTAILVCGACASPGDESVGEISQNGISQNGISMNGISMNGISMNGTSLNGATITGVSVSGTSSTGSAITASSTTAPPLSGGSLVGSTWNATASNGAAVKLRVDSAMAGASPSTDLWFYGISYQTSGGWSPLCGLDASNQAILAVSVAGTWAAVASDSAHYAASTTQFTLACRARTIAKCVELGYKTYRGYTNQLTSCVRLLRGDYCGSGNAYTIDGTTLNLYDNVGVQADTEAWAVEAEWTPSGARCVNSYNASRFEFVTSKDPKCVKGLETATCGSSFAGGAVLIDELPQSAQSQTTQTK
jgi:hypothetical protein